MSPWIRAACALAFVVVSLPSTVSAESVAIGSKNFTESRLLGEIMAQLIENSTDLEVVRRLGLGGTTVVFSALESGEIDIYAEYTGTGWAVHLGVEERVDGPLQAYATVRDVFAERWDLVWGQPFGFNNTYAVGMRGDLAEELGVTRVSELAPHAAGLRAGVTHEFLNREDGFPGLAEAYGLHEMQVNGMEHGLAYEALAADEVDIVDSYTTDGKLTRFDVRILEDDLGYFPPYDCAPLVRGDLLREHPEVDRLLDALAWRIDDERMQALNAEIEVDGRSFADVARQFLDDEGLVGDDISGVVQVVDRGSDWLGFYVSRLPATARLTGEHVVLTALAVLFAVLLSVPLGILVARDPRFDFAVGAAGVIQTIPSLALLALMIPIPFLGLGVRSAVVALFLYALLPILRNTVTGIREVDADLVEAARGMGLTERQLLFDVQLPLAVPTLMAGIRTATTISIGFATLAAFIGAGGLGEPIVTGLQLNDPRLIVSGAVPAALLALIVDFALGRLERRLTPRGLE